MQIYESQIEDLIFETDNEILFKRGLCLNENKVRQVNLGSYGIADMICYEVSDDGFINIQLIEIKKGEINKQTFFQSIRYAKAITEILKEEKKVDYRLQIILIGSEICLEGDFVFITDIFKNVLLYKFRIDLITGVTFKMEYGYRLEESNLPQLKSIINE